MCDWEVRSGLADIWVILLDTRGVVASSLPSMIG